MDSRKKLKKISSVYHKQDTNIFTGNNLETPLFYTEPAPEIVINSDDEISFYSEKLKNTNLFLRWEKDLDLNRRVIDLEHQHNIFPNSFDWSKSWDDSITKMLTQIPLSSLGQVSRKNWEQLINGTGKRIAKKYVHKHNAQSVLLSNPVNVAEILYFSMALESFELRFDHPSDHVQGMLVIEALRQAGLASAHIHGIDIDTQAIMLSININFDTMLEADLPILIRTTTNIPQQHVKKKKPYWIAFEVIQAGKSCVTGGWDVRSYSKKSWERIRHRTRNHIKTQVK